MKQRYRSYVTCKNCGFTIQLPFECRFEYPLHFAATCPLCKHIDVYHRLEVVQENNEYCGRELEKVEKTTKQLEDAVTQSFLLSAIYPPMQILIETLSALKHKLGDIGGKIK